MMDYFDNHLLSPAERDYFSYYLNNEKFTNGPAIRNNYGHGTTPSYSEESHKENYFQLVLFVLLLLKKIRRPRYEEVFGETWIRIIMEKRMRVLWFEISVPARYKESGIVTGGWQDSLERIVRTCPEIELSISFKGEKDSVTKEVDGVKYIPLHLNYTIIDRIKNKFSWDIETRYLIYEMQKVVDNVKPDIIHVFGVEWPYGHIAKFTNIPVVVHILGSLVPYMNALYPPFFSYKDICKTRKFLNLKQNLKSFLDHLREKTWEKQEREVWKCVKYYMGRTEWDKALSNVMHPGRTYYHVDEALRPSFLLRKDKWHGLNNNKLCLISTGCSTFWKGPDMLLKVARILTELRINFEWKVAGSMPYSIKKAVEMKLKTTFDENHIVFLGFTKPERLTEILCESTIYVHTAYIENSPNAICEAQCLGVPIVSTNVGGIATLVQDKRQGVLVPANDPWQMANAIIELANDKNRMIQYSDNSIERALKRHNDSKIKEDLLSCYRSILQL